MGNMITSGLRRITLCICHSSIFILCLNACTSLHQYDSKNNKPAKVAIAPYYNMPYLCDYKKNRPDTDTETGKWPNQQEDGNSLDDQGKWQVPGCDEISPHHTETEKIAPNQPSVLSKQ